MATTQAPQRADDGVAWATPKPGMNFTGQAAILDHTGDTRLMWDKNNPEEVAAAKETFERLTKNSRYSAFIATGDKGERGKRLDKFDPNVERMILVPAYAGG